MSLWDRSPIEGDEEFLWFQAFRDARPPRKLERIRVAVPGKVAPTLEKLLGWYNEYNWRERAAAWDAHLDILRQVEKEDAARMGAKEHAEADQALLNETRDLAARELHKFIRTSMSSEAESLKMNEVVKLLEATVKLGRLVRGETTETVGVEYDMSSLTDEELKRMIALREKIKKKS